MKESLKLLGFSILIAGLMQLVIRLPREAQAQVIEVQRWEYLYATKPESLGELGRNGWELVSVVVAYEAEPRYRMYGYYFKRPLP